MWGWGGGDKETLGEDDREKVGQCCMLYCRCVRFLEQIHMRFNRLGYMQKASTSSVHCCITHEICTGLTNSFLQPASDYKYCTKKNLYLSYRKTSLYFLPHVLQLIHILR